MATTNDYGYANDPAKAEDSRWVHRPARQEARYLEAKDPATVPGRVSAGLRRMIQVRAACAALAGGALTGFRGGRPAVLGYTREAGGERVLVLGNFSEVEQHCPAEVFSALPGEAHELLTDRPRALGQGLTLAPYELVWLRC